MLKKALEFSEIELFHPDSTFDFYASWNDLNSKALRKLGGLNCPLLINASYLFANLSQEQVLDLAQFLTARVREYKNVYFVFQNPDRIDRNEQWEYLKTKINYKLIDSNVEKVMYKTNRNSLREAGFEDVYYEILALHK